MKEAIGYLTDDGTFYENKEDAIYHDARNTLAFTLAQRRIDPDAIIPIIEEFPQTFIDFAQATINKHHPNGEPQPLSTQPQQAERDPSMPHIRLRPQSETIPD